MTSHTRAFVEIPGEALAVQVVRVQDHDFAHAGIHVTSLQRQGGGKERHGESRQAVIESERHLRLLPFRLGGFRLFSAWASISSMIVPQTRWQIFSTTGSSRR